MPANQNQLFPNNHGEAYALSSDEEMFQECESTFDSLNVAATAASKSILSESGKQIGYNADVFNNAVAINAAHSTNYGAADDVSNTTGTFQLAMEDGDVSIIKAEIQKSTEEQSQGDKTGEDQLHWDITLEKEPSLTPQEEVQVDKTFEENSGGNETFEERLQIDRTLEREVPGAEILNEQSQSNTTLEKAPQSHTTVEELPQNDKIPLNELHGKETSTEESSIEKTLDEKPQGNETVDIEDIAVNSEVDTNTTITLSHTTPDNDLPNVFSETISSPTRHPTVAEPLSPSPDIANETHVVSTHNFNNVTQVLDTLSTPSSRAINQTVTLPETPIQFNSIGIIGSLNINASNETVAIGMDQLNITHNLNALSPSTKEIDQTVTFPPAPPACHDFNATTVINSVNDHSLNDTVDITPPSPTSDVVLEKKLDNPIPADVTMDVDRSNELPNWSGPKHNGTLNGAMKTMAELDFDGNEEAIVQEEVINKLAATLESETMDIDGSFTAASDSVGDTNQDSPNNDDAARRLSIRQDLFDKMRENKNTENAVADCDVFKVPFPPQPFQSGFSNSQFGVTDDDFQANGSKFFFILL